MLSKHFYLLKNWHYRDRREGVSVPPTSKPVTVWPACRGPGGRDFTSVLSSAPRQWNPRFTKKPCRHFRTWFCTPWAADKAWLAPSTASLSPWSSGSGSPVTTVTRKQGRDDSFLEKLSTPCWHLDQGSPLGADGRLQTGICRWACSASGARTLCCPVFLPLCQPFRSCSLWLIALAAQGPKRGPCEPSLGTRVGTLVSFSCCRPPDFGFAPVS